MARIYESRKRILVTGGAGFLGSHLIDRLLEMGHEVLSEALAKNPYHYERRAVTRAKMRIIKHFLTPKLADIPMPTFIENYLTTAPEGPTRFATVLLKETKRLLALDRYERRALSRRKFAIRAFDEVRRMS